MDILASVLVLLVLLWACFYALTSYLPCRKPGRTTLPPGPFPLPIIGNILELGNKPHQALANLSKTHGPLMTLKLGSLTTIVISSPQIAKEALQKHDQALSSRTIPDCVQVHDHHNIAMSCLPASTRWRNLRKICAKLMFTAQRLDASQGLRRKKVQELLDYVHECCNSGQAIDVGQAAFITTLNLISNTFFSIDLAGYNPVSCQKFSSLVWGFLEECGKPNLSDYFPILRLADPQGSRRRTEIHTGKLFQLFDGIIDERMQQGVTSKTRDDVLDALLRLTKENNSELSLLDAKHLLLDLFIAGTDTTSSMVEWAMAELLQYPEILVKAKNELKEVKGLVQESDIPKLPYLQAIVKETFRLHPPAPFLLPHKAESEVEICGYKVPKNAQILVNVWAMGKDPSIWQNPNLFFPERFLNLEIDVKGRDFELIPFGAGRRICPGLPLAQRMLHLMLASLIQSFDWKLPYSKTGGDIDMSDKFGLTLHKFEPLLAIPFKI